MRTPGLLSVALLPAVFAGASPAAEHSIRPDGAGDFATIQEAVDAAAPGDSLVLEDGVFTGPGNRDIRFAGKDLVVRSRNGAAAVALDAQGGTGDPHRLFRLDAGETSASRIEGLTLRGGFVEGPFPENGGGAILVAYGSHPVITQCVFDGNKAGYQGFGAGLLAWDDCDITLTDCTFTNGDSGWYGGGFTLRLNSDALVERVTVTYNHSGHAGGGASITGSNAILNDCLFAHNSTDEAHGGGLLIKAGAMPVLTRCVFVGNEAFLGGAMGLGNYPDVVADQCLFLGNSAAQGGAISIDQDPSVLTLTNCTFALNHASLARHILDSVNATCTVLRCILDDDCSGSGAIWVSPSAVLDIDCCVLPGGPSAVLGQGVITYGPGNVDADPRFCAPDACDFVDPVGDYALDSTSPAAPAQNPCGLVGAYDVGCSITAAGAALEARSWGSVKAAYRDGADR